MEGKIAREPEVLQHQFERARLLTRMGRLQEAKDAYIEILKKDPNQFASFVNLGAILVELRHRQPALKVFREIARRFPESPLGPLNIARVLYEMGATKQARAQYEAMLRVFPNHADAHYGFSDLLMEQHEYALSMEHRRKGFENQPWTFSHYRGEKEPVRLLLLGTAHGGNSPIQRCLDDRIFLTAVTYTDFYNDSIPFPPHQLVINAISEVDRCGNALDVAERMLERVTVPVLNAPAKIRVTGREDSTRLLGAIEGVVAPRTVTLSRAELAGREAVSMLEERGLAFPILVRAPGYHGGAHFSKVDRAEDLASVVAELPGEELTVIQYLDAREQDGKIRKCRVMMIGGKLYPLHKAVSDQWKIHYFSSQMADSPGHRAEEAAFLEDMPAVLGPRAMRALKQIQETLGLDYAGADFSLGRTGEVLLFEANATMTAAPPEPGAQWDYRRDAVKNIRAAVQEMILARVGAGS